MTPLGITASTTGINTGIATGSNLVNGLIGNFFWNEQAEKAYKLNEKSADNAMKRSIDLYNLLQSPQAIVNQLKEAGLSKSLMYSKGGIGGQTQSGPQGGGPTGMVGANTLGIQQIDPLTMAQIQNINADTKLKEEKTTNTKFDTELKKATTTLTKSQEKLNNLDFDFKDSTFWSRYNETYYAMLKMQGEAQEALANGTLAQESYEERLANFAIQNMKTNCEIALLQSKTALTDAQKEVALVEARKLTEEICYIMARTGFYDARTQLTDAEITLTEHQAEEILRRYSWKYFTKEDLFKAWNNLNGTAQAVAEFIPLSQFSNMVTETITQDSKGGWNRTVTRHRPPNIPPTNK